MIFALSWACDLPRCKRFPELAILFYYSRIVKYVRVVFSYDFDFDFDLIECLFWVGHIVICGTEGTRAQRQGHKEDKDKITNQIQIYLAIVFFFLIGKHILVKLFLFLIVFQWLVFGYCEILGVGVCCVGFVSFRFICRL